MPDFQRIAAICFVTIGFLTGSHAVAQEEGRPADPVVTPEVEGASPQVERVKTTILFVRDERTGKLLPVPDLTLDELARLKRLQDEAHLPQDEPNYHFAESSITGTANADRVSLKILYDIVVHETGWNRVALRLGGTAIVSSEFEGEGEHFLEYDDEEESYFAWIRPATADATHRLKIDVLTQVVDAGNEQRLELKLPRVVGLRSSPAMTLRVPIENAAGFAKSGTQICPVEAKSIGKQTELQVVQTGGDLSLTWRSTKVQTTKTKPVVFDANSRIIVTWDSQSRVVWDAKIELNVLQGQLTTAKVKLPEGARLVEQEFDGQRISIAEPTGEDALPSHVEVEFDRVIAQGQTGEIRVRCERQLDPRATGAKTVPDVAGFAVDGAVRQSGYFGFVLASVWRANLGSMANVSRPYEMPEGFRDSGVSGSNTFQFLSQPFSLHMSVSPRERRVTTSGVFVLDYSPGQISLEARLSYNVVGRHLDVCSAILPGWDIESISLIDGEAIESLEFDPPTESRLDVNLPREMNGEFELRIAAGQKIPVDADFSVVNLPAIEDEQLGPTKLVVVADDDLQVSFDADRSTGVMPGGDVSSLQLPARNYPPQAFEVGEESSASFAAELLNRPGKISVASHAKIEVARSSLAMEQSLVYDVRHEPVSTLSLIAPAWWSTRSTAMISIDGDPVRTTGEPEALENGLVRLTLPLQEPRLGTIEVTARYDVALSELPPSEPTASIVSFALPQDVGDISQFFVSINAEEAIHVGFKGGELEPTQSSTDSVSEALQLTADEIPASCDLILTYQDHDAPRSTIIDRVWVQTWLTSSGRQDRAVFRVFTNEPSIAMRLPPSAVANQLMLVIDGVGIAVPSSEDGVIVLPLERAMERTKSHNGQMPHVIELGWQSKEISTAMKKLPFEMPLVQEAWIQHVRWHVVTPRNQLLFAAPRGMTGDLISYLAWWRPLSSVRQQDYEMWVGASTQPSPESIGQSGSFQQYSFASIGSAEDAYVTSVSASFALLAASGIALLGGAAFFYIRPLRHPGVIVASSLLLVGLAFNWPALALFGGQAAVIVIVVLIVARILQIPFLQRRGRRRAPRRPAGLSGVVGMQGSSRLRTDAALAVSPSTTANVGRSLPVGTPDLQ